MYVGLINECLPIWEREKGYIMQACITKWLVYVQMDSLVSSFFFFNAFQEEDSQHVRRNQDSKVPLSLLRRFSHRRLKKCHEFRKGERLKFLETGQNSPLTNNIKTYKIHKHGKTFVNHYLQNMKNAQSRE